MFYLLLIIDKINLTRFLMYDNLNLTKEKVCG